MPEQRFAQAHVSPLPCSANMSLSSEQKSCFLCGGEGRLLYDNLHDRLVGTPGSWRVLVCPEDQHAWLFPVPSEVEIPGFYEADYYTHESTTVQSTSERLKEMLVDAALHSAFGYPSSKMIPSAMGWLAVRLIPGLLEFAGSKVMWLREDQKGRLLDVGCGSGEFISRMRALGWTTKGVEPDRHAAAVARRRLMDEDAVVSTLPTPNTWPKFDVITANQVLEHVRDPIRFLGDMSNALSPGGLIVITTPNNESQAHTRFRRNWFCLDPPRHIHLFSAASLKRCAASAGLTVEACITCARAAYGNWRASEALERTADAGGCLRLSSSTSVRARALWHVLQQNFMLTVRPYIGDNLVLFARK